MSIIDKFQLNNSVALITGGAGLLGRQHALAILAGQGRPVLLDIDETRLEEAKRLIEQESGKQVLAYQLDITNEKQVRKITDKIIREVGPIEILINNAANNPQVKKGQQASSRLENFDEEQWNRDLAVGLTGAFLMSKAIGTHMAKQGKGVILNIASDLGVIAPDQRLYRKEGLTEEEQPVKAVTYSVVKHGIIGLTKYLATYWAKQGVRANSISPGGVQTPEMPEEFLSKISNLIPMGRMAKTDEYQAAILFLCSDASSYMTGANLIIDGGRTCW